jgi:MYXO-CTERM domain-containing protein
MHRIASLLPRITSLAVSSRLQTMPGGLKACLLAAIGVCLLSAVPGKASFIPALDETGGSVAAENNNYTVGSAFTVGATPISVTALALQYLNSTDVGTVRIYQSGTTTNLASVNITTSTPLSVAPSGHSYAVVSITPLTLSANTTYDIVWDDSAGASIQLGGSVTSSDPDITFTNDINASGDGQFPTGAPFFDYADFGPTFVTSPLTSVPEPSTFVVASLGVLMLGAVVLHRRRRGPAN